MPIKRRGPDLVRVIEGIPGKIKRDIPATLEKIGVIIEAEIKTLLLTPGRGRLRHNNAARPDRLGKGSYRTVKGALKRVKRGVPRTNIDLTNRASAPGDPPAPDTGQLQRSITHEVQGDSVRIGSPLEYAEPLEFGSLPRGGGTNKKAGRGELGSLVGGIAPRPFIRPGVDNTRGEVAEEIVNLMKRGTRR